MRWLIFYSRNSSTKLLQASLQANVQLACNIHVSAMCWRDPMKALRSWLHKMCTISLYNHLFVRISKRCITLVVSTIFLPHMHSPFKCACGVMKKRIISNAYRIPPTGQWRKLISRIQRPYKNFFGMTLLHAHAQYIYIVNAKYHKPSVKALVEVDFPVYAQANPYLKANRKKMAHFWHQTSSCKCSMSLYCVGKVLNCFSTSCGTSWIPRICTIYTHVIQNC